ncbi:hypothetical protein DFH94DRAFT_750919 [Russula ochroleuca]|jgi:hypothetical protein|uniref:Uncharacterized protein n=1 Tax=Russula ochroleuca TaxID=152965 RepID=A0A9P5MTU1_9AGAM|nr:hypothetical protein DFH94DRAFT_750919 [Russula ochroleuca]
MPLSCQPFQRGPHPRTCRTRPQVKTLSNAVEKPLLAMSSQRNDVGSLHTVNVVFPQKSRPSHSVTFGKGDEPLSPDRSRNRSSTKVNDIYPNAEISVVPGPVPNPLVQVHSSSVAEHTTPLPDSPHTVAGNASSSVFVYPATHLLPLPSTASVLSGTSFLSFAQPTSASAERPLNTFNKVPSQQTTPHQLPAVAVILLATGGVLFVAAILILTKLCLRPQRRCHPTPSLPILQDAFPQRKMGDESPLFGGKERLSSQPGNNAVPWTWTQYQSDMLKPVPAASISKSDATNQPPMRYSRLVDEPQNVLHVGEPAMHGALAKPGTTNRSDGHPNKALSRLSSLSGLVYPASVYESSGQENIGIAVSSGQGDLEFGGSAARDYRKRASARQSMRSIDKRRSTIYGSPEGLAYTMSPSLSPGGGRDDSDGSSGQGRAPVKAPYVAGSYLRGSPQTGPDRSHPDVNPFGDPENGAYTLPPTPGSFARKETSLKGGAMLVGSIAPDPPVSPGFSIYPDDSLSVTEDRNWAVPKLIKGQEYTRDRQGSEGDGEDSMAITDERDEQLSGATSPGVATRRLSMINGSVGRAREQQMKRTDDRPPRVPSPPMLPSLAQMAMAHTNGQDYGEYRSPTYSLYGLYS